MNSFSQWLNNSSNIQVDLSQYESDVRFFINKNVEHIKANRIAARNFDINDFFSYIKQNFSDYPNYNKLILDLQSKNLNRIFSLTKELRAWLINAKKPATLAKPIYFDYVNYLDYSTDLNDDNFESQTKEVIEKTKSNSALFVEKIKNTLTTIEWNNTPIVVVVSSPRDERNEFIFEPANGYVVYLGDIANHTSFSAYLDNQQVIIDDVLDADEQDFFTDDKVKQDYFNLISGLRNPNAKSKKMVLYTARPVKDREFYLSTNYCPANIFLTNNVNHVEGLASDLGNNEVRDIWKVLIESKYLITTLEGRIKYYQVTKQCPAHFELLVAGK